MNSKKLLEKFKMLFVMNHDEGLLQKQSGSSKNNDIIYVDGKRYIKIKLRFIETAGFNLAEHIEDLETEVEALKKENSRFIELNANLENKINELQILNINLFNENRIITGTIKKADDDIKQVIKYKNEIINLENSLNKANASIHTLQKYVNQLNSEIIFIKTKAPKVNEKKDVKNNHSSKNMQEEKNIESLYEKVRKLKKQISISENTIIQKNDLIKTLTQQLFGKNNSLQ